MGKNKKEIIFNNRGELCNKLIEQLNKDCNKRFIPVCTDQGYRFDWSIIGFEYQKYFGYPHMIDNKLYPIKPRDVEFNQWVKACNDVRTWINWLSIKLFYPTRMIGSKFATDSVLLRVGVSMLNKIDLPRYYKDNLFDNLIECYYNRKKPYDTFYYREILGIPF